MDSIKQPNAHVVCGSIQSIALNLEHFKDTDFDYLIIDEAHHASADTYQKVLAYFKPKFTLGLTATPERTDDNRVILDIFKNTAHKLDIKTAVEIGELVPVRCICIHTNIDLNRVRFNSVQYNIRDLESKIYVPERNRLIVDTWLEYVKNRRTVIFCASVKHANEVAMLFENAGIRSASVSGSMKSSERNEALARFASGDIQVLCACDLLNEGWDCPQTEVLFMARPTMSKVLYTQQLARGSLGMISQMEFVRQVDVQAETIERYVRDGMLVPDLVVSMSEHLTFKYFKEETLAKYAEQYGWSIITDDNRKDLFMAMIHQMDMSYSYKSVLIQAILLYTNDNGRIQLSDIGAYFRDFYESRHRAGQVVEKPNSIFAEGDYTDKEVEWNILANSFKRFEDMHSYAIPRHLKPFR